jgi:signal transduction histidine kinase
MVGPRDGGRRSNDKDGGAVRVVLWQTAPLPDGFTQLWRHELGSLAELSRLRARVRTALTGRPTVEHPEREHWSERMVLVVDELASNALRHGGSPVAATLSRSDEAWLIAVDDSSPRMPPTPARGRDPGRGGFGLYLVADLAHRHGWCPEIGAKTVWAVMTPSAVGG